MSVLSGAEIIATWPFGMAWMKNCTCLTALSSAAMTWQADDWLIAWVMLPPFCGAENATVGATPPVGVGVGVATVPL
jgi:hypothetical protein